MISNKTESSGIQISQLIRTTQKLYKKKKMNHENNTKCKESKKNKKKQQITHKILMRLMLSE